MLPARGIGCPQQALAHSSQLSSPPGPAPPGLFPPSLTLRSQCTIEVTMKWPCLSEKKKKKESKYNAYTVVSVLQPNTGSDSKRPYCFCCFGPTKDMLSFGSGICKYRKQLAVLKSCRVLVQSFSCVQLHNTTDCSTPGFPVLPHLPESAQTHVH